MRGIKTLKVMSDYITDLYIQWKKEADIIKKDIKKGSKSKSSEYNWGYLWGIERCMWDLANLKLKAITIEMLNKTSHQRKVEEREKTNRPLWAGSKDFKDWQPKKNK